MSEIITTDDILAKQVVGPDGSVLGTVVKIHVHKHKLKIIGITIDKGFMRPDLFVGIEFVKNFGIDTIFLDKIPKETYFGMRIITDYGMEIGKVKDVIIDGFKIKGIVGSAREGFFKKEEFKIAMDQIKEIGASIILKKGIKL